MTSAPAPPVVGRTRELRLLHDAFDETRAGQPRVVVVRGEAGIGKSRLVAEFLAAPLDGEPVIAIGQCVDLGEIGTPFTPVRRMLQDLTRGVGEDAVRAAARTPGVIAALDSLIPGLAADDATAAPSRHLAEAVERVLESLSESRQLLLVIEDLHWADAATLALLQALSLTAHAQHVMFVLTYRTDDVGRTHPLRPLLAELERNRNVTMIDVEPLDAADAARLVAVTAPGLDTADIDAIVSRSDGVPFFVEELAARGGAEQLPGTLRDLVLARYDLLDEPVRQVLAAAAVGGVAIDEELLRDILGADSVGLRTALRAAVDAGVLISNQDGLSFRHALIREFAAAELLPGERAELHRGYAQALQERIALGAADQAPAAAEHWLACHDVAAAFQATVIARERAREAAAPAAAVRLGERLLELWPQVEDAEAVAGRSRAELYYEVAEGWRMLNAPSRCERLLRDGLRALADAQPHDRAPLHRVLAMVRYDQGRGDDAADEARRSVDLLSGLPGAEADPVLATALSTLSTLTADTAAAAVYSSRAVAIAERSGDERAMDRADLALVWLTGRDGEDESGLEVVRRMMRRRIQPEDMVIARTNESDLLFRLGRYSEAIDSARDGVAVAVDTGLERGAGVVTALNLIEAQVAVAENAEAERGVLTLMPLLDGMPMLRSGALRFLCLVLLWCGREAELRALREAESAFIADLDLDALETIGWLVIEIETTLNGCEGTLSADDARTGTAAIEHALTEALRLPEMASAERGLVRLALPMAARLIAAARRRGIRPGLCAQLTGIVHDELATFDRGRPAAAVHALVAAENADSPAGWREAVTVLEGGGLPVRNLDYARFRLVGSLLAAGERAEAARTLDQSLDLCRTPAVAGWLHDLAARSGSGQTAGGIPTLTERETQVLELVAQGLTNAQIGERLFISPKTASVHVSAILSKLGARTRGEAAAMLRASSEPR
ncbi:hypothetical protein DY023_15970 [Microbacterium bovistercoris]|uniref:HTH luxR-type domain-containing protein n=1 Tax=Microbacterium bovistercoris TaxID=2293570 RepID=A0A371NQG5_9MICO|nr:LuxR family transcriptional regulator [Microbacterium bovistercoris]REJ04390.1 hypothetical protein DY023_15970 [Microbacterium bovistercoris]